MDDPNPYLSPSDGPAPLVTQIDLPGSDEFDRVCVASVTLGITSAVLALFAMGMFVSVGPYTNSQNATLMFAVVAAASAIGVLLGIRAWYTGFRHAKVIICLNVSVFTFATIPLLFVADIVGLAIFG